METHPDTMTIKQFSELVDDVVLATAKPKKPGIAARYYDSLKKHDKKTLMECARRLSETSEYFPSLRTWMVTCEELELEAQPERSTWGVHHQPVQRNASFELNVRRIHGWIKEGMSAEEAYSRRMAEIHEERHAQC